MVKIKSVSYKLNMGTIVKNKNIKRVTLVSAMMFLYTGLAFADEIEITINCNNFISKNLSPPNISNTSDISNNNNFHVVKANNYSSYISKKEKSHNFENNLLYVYYPKLTLNGALVNNDVLGTAQLLYPIKYNMNEGDSVLFGIVNTQIDFGKRNPKAGVGFLYRKIIEPDNWIFGGFLTANYSKSDISEKSYIVINPGIEFLGKIFDFRSNVYFPIGRSKWVNDKEIWADEFGIYNYISYSQHNQYNYKLRESQEIHRGIDAEIGYKIPRIDALKLFVGGYHFDSQDLGSSNGLDSRLQYKANDRVSYEIAGAYDINTKKKYALASIKLSFGGMEIGNTSNSKAYSDFNLRLSDPIERDFYTISRWEIRNENPIFHEGFIKSTSQALLQHDNIWFFTPAISVSNDTTGDGTYENPFSGFTPDNYEIISKNNKSSLGEYPSMYFAPGNYNFNGFTSRGFLSRFALPKGWGMYGKDENYKSSALGNRRPYFDVTGPNKQGGLDMIGTAEDTSSIQNTLDSIEIYSQSSSIFASGYPSIQTLYLDNNINLKLRNVILVSDVYDNFSSVGNTYRLHSQCVFADHNSSILFESLPKEISTGENIILAHAQNTDSSGSTQTSSIISIVIGLKLDNHSSATFVSGTNSILVDYYAKNVNFSSTRFNLYSHAIHSSHESKIDFSGGNNEISITVNNNLIGNRETDTAIHAIENHASTTSFNGGKNFVNINFRSSYPLHILTTENLHGDEKSIIQFIDGDNYISTSIDAAPLTGIGTSGIYLDNSQAIFSKKSNVNISTAGSNAWGIYIYANSNVYFTNPSLSSQQTLVTYDNADTLLNDYVTIIHPGIPATSGYKIEKAGTGSWKKSW